jgi:ECF transporter S component (folate family)
MIHKKNTTKRKGSNIFGKSNVSTLVLAGIFVALYVILNFFSIVVSNFLIIRFSFLVFVAAGYVFEPMMAMQIGFVSDLLAFLIKPQGFYFVGFTLNAILVCYIYSHFLHNRQVTKQRVILTVGITVALISFILNPIWLYFMYNTNVYSIMRVATAIIKYPIDVFLAYSVLKLLERVNFNFTKSKN